MTKPQLPAFALPFVTRAFRGGRKKRFVVLSAVMAVVSLFLGFWLALGNGPMEQELRVSLDLEQSEWEREHKEFIQIVHTYDEELMYSEPYMLESMRSEARSLLAAAVAKPAVEREHLELQAAAGELLEREGWPEPTSFDPYFEWYDEWTVERISAIVDKDMKPEVVTYSSPLGVSDAFALLGFISGGILVLLGFIFGPLTVGVQQAQEMHENTLQPLTGTALNPRELVLGLASGPLSVVALFAAPQVLLYLLASLVSGSVFAATGMLVVTLAGCAALSLLAMLAGQIMGRRRTPGIVGGFLLCLLGFAAVVGMAFGLNMDDDVISAMTLLPQGSAFYLLHEAFTSQPQLASHDMIQAVSSIAVGVLGLAVGAGLLMLVVERRVAGRSGPALTRTEALVGAVTAIILAMMTIPVWNDPWRQDTDELFYFLTLALLAPAMAILVMSRVPMGDLPPSLRRVPLKRILGELGAMLGIHLVAVLAICADPLGFGGFHPVSMVYLLWCAGVLVLLSVRAVAYPMTILSGLWTVFCGIGLVVGFVHAVMWAADKHLDAMDVVGLAQLSPLLGLAQVVLLVWIPVSLVRGLRKNLAGI